MTDIIKPIRLLTFSTLYPNAGAPNHGVFVENRLRQLVATGEAQAQIIAPVSWRSTAPAFEHRHGLDIRHPKFLAIPGVSTWGISPLTLYAAARPALARLRDAGHQFDLIDAHYLYPDGVAAIWLGRHFNLPVVLTARGSDVTQFPDYAIPRRLIRGAALAADGLITVSAGLRTALAKLGVPEDRITVLRNGVDLHLFQPTDRAAARATLGLAGPTLLSVGGLIPRKGHDLTIAALSHLPNWQLLIAGDGPERAALLSLATRLGVADRVRLLGPVPHAELAGLYTAADISVLSSAREGWANVLLESMACGTPVVASPIPGNDEVVRARPAGLIAAARTPQAIAAAVLDLAASPPLRTATRAYAAEFGWGATSAGQIELFRKVIEKQALLF